MKNVCSRFDWTSIMKSAMNEAMKFNLITLYTNCLFLELLLSFARLIISLQLVLRILKNDRQDI